MDLTWTLERDSFNPSRSTAKTTFDGRAFQRGTNIGKKTELIIVSASIDLVEFLSVASGPSSVGF